MRTFFLLLISSTIICSATNSNKINVVPKPQYVQIFEESLNIGPLPKVNLDENISNEVILSQLNQEFNLITLNNPNNLPQVKVTIELKILKTTSDFGNLFKSSALQHFEMINDEGYALKISAEGITIAAKTERGIFYGVQSLKQILRSNRSNFKIPKCLIIDYPEMWFRSISDDISRGPIPTMEYLKYQIRRAAELKYNHWMHYVEHVVKTEKHGQFAPPDGSLSIAEIKELSEYAKKYYITFFGNFQSFGHFRSINSYPQYQHLIEMETILSPTLDQSYQFLEEVYDELIPAFDAPFFAINCDETFDLGKAESKKLVDSIGIANVFTNHITRIKKIVDKHNVKTIVWADEPLKYPEILDDLPKDIILGTWTYDAKEYFDSFINPIVEKGFEFMVCPGVLNSTRVMPNFHTSIKNIRNFCRDGLKGGAMGMLNCVWDDGGFALFNRDWYGVAYGGEQSWNHNVDDINVFNERFNNGIYGDNSNSLTNTIYKLLELSDLPQTDNMNEKILWTSTIPERFKSTSISLENWDLIKKISQEAKSELAGRDNYIYTDDYLVYEFTSELYEYIADLRLNIVYSADHYRRAMLNQKNKELCRSLILASLNAIDKLIIAQNRIYYNYQYLWLKENRTYALDRVTDKMEVEQTQLKNLSGRLLESLKDFDKGLYLKPPDDIGLKIKKISGQYFRGWLMINPLPYEETGSADYLMDMGGELFAKPKVTNEFYYNNKKYRWKRIYSDYLDIVNIKELFPELNQNSVMYAFAELYAEEDIEVVAQLGVDDRADVILNGERVLNLGEKRSFLPDELDVKLKLKNGRNNLMLKVPQTDGEWKFTFKLRDNQFKGHKNRYRISE